MVLSSAKLQFIGRINSNGLMELIKSNIKIINVGVPQGSVLGPLFFLLYIKDIFRAVDDTIIRRFADDTSLLMYDQNLNL